MWKYKTFVTVCVTLKDALVEERLMFCKETPRTYDAIMELQQKLKWTVQDIRWCAEGRT
jgi:hypothetical protein